MNDPQRTTSVTNWKMWLSEQWNVFFTWLGKQVGAILAILIIYYIGSPIAYFAIDHLKKDINEVFPSSVTTTELEEFRRNPAPMVYNQRHDRRKKNVEALEKDVPNIQKKEITRTESMVARVWTYALRTFGLLGALGITVWAAVTLAKTD